MESDSYEKCTTTSSLRHQWDKDRKAIEMQQDNLNRVIQSLKALRKDAHQHRQQVARSLPDRISSLNKILSKDRRSMLETSHRHERAAARINTLLEREKARVEIQLLEAQRAYLSNLPQGTLPEIPAQATISLEESHNILCGLPGYANLEVLREAAHQSRVKHETLREEICSQIQLEAEKLVTTLDSGSRNIRREIAEAEAKIRDLHRESWSLHQKFHDLYTPLEKKERDEAIELHRKRQTQAYAENYATKEADIARRVYISRTPLPDFVIQNRRVAAKTDLLQRIETTLNRLNHSLPKK